jgi:hypothetical protein
MTSRPVRQLFCCTFPNQPQIDSLLWITLMKSPRCLRRPESSLWLYLWLPLASSPSALVRTFTHANSEPCLILQLVVFKFCRIGGPSQWRMPVRIFWSYDFFWHISLTLHKVIIAIYVDSFLFIFCTAVLSKAYSLNQSAGICDGAILLCLLCYMTTKIVSHQDTRSCRL